MLDPNTAVTVITQQYLAAVITQQYLAAVITQQYLAAMGLLLVYQSSYSPDLNLSDRFPFTRLKEVIRPVQYDSNDEVVEAAQHFLRSLPEDYLIHEFLGHCKAVIRSGRDYVTC